MLKFATINCFKLLKNYKVNVFVVVLHISSIFKVQNKYS